MYLNGERFYPVDIKTQSWLRQEYQAKLLANEKDGLNQFASGNPKLFGGYDAEGLRRTYNLIVVYDSGSQAEFIDRVSGPLWDLSNRYGIPAIASGVGEKPDLMPHTTVEVGRVSPDLPDDQVKKIFNWMNSSYSHLKPLAEILTGIQFKHDYLVMSPNAYTCDSTPDTGQGVAFRTRRLILSAMASSLAATEGPLNPMVFAEPYRYDNLFHGSAWRAVPSDEPTKSLRADVWIAFAQEANATVGKSLQGRPMLLRVGSVYMGSAYDFIHSDAPHLIKAA